MILKTLLVVFTLPILVFAIEPLNPKSLCERYIKDEDKQSCLKKIEKEDFDWYAAGICDQQKDEPLFQACWNVIKNAHFSPADIENCDDENKLTDIERIRCLDKAKSRAPASINSGFQPLVIQKNPPAKEKISEKSSVEKKKPSH